MDNHPQIGEVLRDEGIARVKASNRKWFNEAKQLALCWLAARRGMEITGEDITVAVEAVHPDEPTSPNVWGALTRVLLMEKAMRPIGRQVPMRKPRSNARRTNVYRVHEIVIGEP